MTLTVLWLRQVPKHHRHLFFFCRTHFRPFRCRLSGRNSSSPTNPWPPPANFGTSSPSPFFPPLFSPLFSQLRNGNKSTLCFGKEGARERRKILSLQCIAGPARPPRGRACQQRATDNGNNCQVYLFAIRKRGLILAHAINTDRQCSTKPENPEIHIHPVWPFSTTTETQSQANAQLPEEKGRVLRTTTG